MEQDSGTGASALERPSAPPPPSIAALVRQALWGHEEDYTRLPLGRAVFLLALPMVMEMAMESLFAIVDIYFVSRLGADAVATVGVTESLQAMVYAAAMGLAMAATAMVARRIGERDVAAGSVAAGQVLLIACVASVLIGVAGALWGGALLSFMGASASVVALGSSYAQITLGSSATVVLLFVLNAVFRGAGDPVTAMRALWLANLANIVLDPMFIFGFGPVPAMGVTGAAVATTLGRSLGVIYLLVVLWRGARRAAGGPAGTQRDGATAPVVGGLRVGLRELVPRRDVIAGLLRVASTGALQTLLETASWLGLVRILSTFGSVALAGYTIAMRIAIFAFLPSLGMANAAATLVGQNLGAGKPDRAARAVWVVGFYNFLFLGSVGVVFSIWPEPIARLISQEPAELRVAASALRIIAIGFFLFAYGMVFVQAFNGAGDTRTPTWLNLFCFWLFKIPLAYLLAMPLGLGTRGVFWSVAAAYSLVAMIAFVLFRRGRWKTHTV